MSGVDVLLAVVGAAVTALTIVGMVLITPRGGIDLHTDEPESQGVDLSRAIARDSADAEPANGRADRAVGELR
jgi:hypothetical protein